MSVARASVMPASSMERASKGREWPTAKSSAGMTTETTPASRSAAYSSGAVKFMWSADTAFNSAARSEPPMWE